MFARADLYSDRPRRPGLGRIAVALFQVTVIALVFALANGNHFSSYYIFYGSLFFGDRLHRRRCASCTRVSPGWLLAQAGYRRRALLVGSGQHIEAVAHALGDRVHEPRRRGRLHLADAATRERAALARDARRSCREILAAERIQEVIIADPDFPQERAVELVDTCHQRGITVQVAPSTMEILFDRAEFVPGQSVPLFTLRPPVFEGIDYALKRTFDLVVSSARAAAALAAAAR